MIRITVVLCILCWSWSWSWSCSAQPTASEVISSINSELDYTPFKGSVDTLKAGNWDTRITGIATTFMATLDALKKAKSAGYNLVLTHEPIFYNHFDNRNEFGEDDEVIAYKINYVETNDMVVFRFHDTPHRVLEDMINQGMIRKLGWEDNHLGDMVFRSEYETLGELAEWLTNHFGTTTVRVVGNPDMRIKKIGLLPGAYGRQSQVRAFNQPEIDALIIGEASEWEAIEYVRDAQEMGLERGLIVMGHADSEEGGMEYVAEWLKGITDLPVAFIPAKNPLWSPK